MKEKRVESKFITAYGPKVDSGFECVGPSMTKQSDKDDCDINKIMAKYVSNGVLTHVSKYQGSYTDLGDGVTYHDALNTIIAADAAFDSLPSAIRNRFDNDPAKFLDFVSDDKNKPEMAKMGLLTDEATLAIKSVNNASLDSPKPVSGDDNEKK